MTRRIKSMKNDKVLINDRVLDLEKNDKLTEQVNTLRRFRGGGVDGQKEKKEGDKQDTIN